MTKEQAKEAAAVMLGWANGKKVQYRSPHSDVWIDVDKVMDTLPWDWTQLIYRLKPTPVLRPWTADEVPLGSQCRTKGDTKRFLIVRTSDESTREEWLNKCEHSTDGGKTWLPCGVEEGGK